MARTLVTLTTLTANAVTVDPAGTNADPTNGHYIVPAGPLEELVVRITNTATTAKTATIKAGDNPPADAAGQGDLGPTSFAAGSVTPTVKFFGPFTSARFVQAGAEAGQIFIDLEAGFTGTVAAFRVPRTA